MHTDEKNREREREREGDKLMKSRVVYERDCYAYSCNAGLLQRELTDRFSDTGFN